MTWDYLNTPYNCHLFHLLILISINGTLVDWDTVQFVMSSGGVVLVVHVVDQEQCSKQKSFVLSYDVLRKMHREVFRDFESIGHEVLPIVPDDTVLKLLLEKTVSDMAVSYRCCYCYLLSLRINDDDHVLEVVEE